MAERPKDELGEPEAEEPEVEETPPRPDPVEDRREAERLRAQLAKANADAKRQRTRLEELERAEREREESKLGEAEKYRRQQSALEERARMAEDKAARLHADMIRMRLEHAIEAVGRDAGFQYPDDVPRLIDVSSIEVDDEGRFSAAAVKAAVEKLKERRPGLMNAGTGRPGTPPRDPQRRPIPDRAGGRPDPDAALEAELRATGVYAPI